MKPRTFRCDDELWRELQTEADELGISRGEYVRRIVTRRGGTKAYSEANTQPNTDVFKTEYATEYEERLEALEARVGRLEGASSPVEPTEEDTEEPPAEPPLRELVDDTDVYPRAGVSQEKRKQRVDAGLAAVRFLRESSGGVSRTEFEHLWSDYPVDGQKPPSESDTYWRKSLRPALQAAQEAGLVEQQTGSWEWYWVG